MWCCFREIYQSPLFELSNHVDIEKAIAICIFILVVKYLTRASSKTTLPMFIKVEKAKTFFFQVHVNAYLGDSGTQNLPKKKKMQVP